MSHPLRSRTAIAALAGLSVVGTLAGCSATTTSAGDPPAGSSQSDTSGSATSKTDNSATYKDGTYTAPGSYASPGGEENISVTLTLADNVITAMKVITVKADPTAAAYEHMFEGGISAVTVGKKLNELNIGVVAGSSLTSMGFNRALATIKADAAS